MARVAGRLTLDLARGEVRCGQRHELLLLQAVWLMPGGFEGVLAVIKVVSRLGVIESPEGGTAPLQEFASCDSDLKECDDDTRALFHRLGGEDRPTMVHTEKRWS